MVHNSVDHEKIESICFLQQRRKLPPNKAFNLRVSRKRALKEEDNSASILHWMK